MRFKIHLTAAIFPALVIAKLAGFIAWPWFWVLSPIWGGLCITVISLIIIALLSNRV